MKAKRRCMSSTRRAGEHAGRRRPLRGGGRGRRPRAGLPGLERRTERRGRSGQAQPLPGGRGELHLRSGRWPRATSCAPPAVHPPRPRHPGQPRRAPPRLRVARLADRLRQHRPGHRRSRHGGVPLRGRRGARLRLLQPRRRAAGRARTAARIHLPAGRRQRRHHHRRLRRRLDPRLGTPPARLAAALGGRQPPLLPQLRPAGAARHQRRPGPL